MKSVSIEHADTLFNLRCEFSIVELVEFPLIRTKKNILRDESSDNLEVAGEAELEWEVPLGKRNQGGWAPVGIFLSQGNMESSIILNV